MYFRNVSKSIQPDSVDLWLERILRNERIFQFNICLPKYHQEIILGKKVKFIIVKV